MFYCITLIILIAVQIWPVRISSSRLLSSFDMIYTNMERRQTRINSGVRMDLEVSFELTVRGCVCVSVRACIYIHTHTDKGTDMVMSVFKFLCYIKDQQPLTAPLLSGITCFVLLLYVSCPNLDSAFFSQGDLVPPGTNNQRQQSRCPGDAHCHQSGPCVWAHSVGETRSVCVCTVDRTICTGNIKHVMRSYRYLKFKFRTMRFNHISVFLFNHV